MILTPDHHERMKKLCAVEIAMQNNSSDQNNKLESSWSPSSSNKLTVSKKISSSTIKIERTASGWKIVKNTINYIQIDDDLKQFHVCRSFKISWEK